MKGVLRGLGLCLALMGSTAQAKDWKIADMEPSLREHLQYLVPLIDKFMVDPQTRDVAKMQVAQIQDSILANSALTLSYEATVMQTKGAICESKAASEIPTVLQQPDGIKAPVMFHPGTLRYVNAQYFRDLCTTYKSSPSTVQDLYNQQMAQIKAYTGGKKANN